MPKFASKSTRGFYTPEIHGENMPADVVEITDEFHAELIDGQSAGKIIDWSGDVPALVDPTPPTREEVIARQWDAIKAKRDTVTTGGVLVNGHWHHSDDKSRVQYLGLKDSARDIKADGGTNADPITIAGNPVVWKTMAGDFVPVTVGLAFDLVAAVSVLDAQAFAAAEQHRAALNASADPEAYDFAAGWPTVYGA